MPPVSRFTSSFKRPPRSDDRHPSKKRKRDRSSSEAGSTDSDVETHPSFRKSGFSVSDSNASGDFSTAFPATLRRELAVQYQAAGQSFDAELPGLRFPHASQYEAVRSSLMSTKSVVDGEVATLKPPLIASRLPTLKKPFAKATAGHSSLRQKHLDNITAVLHRCVLDGDFNRAGRAWGMLLRAEQSGHGMDIRKQDQWGLGAEILLKRDTYTVEESHGGEEILGLDKNLMDHGTTKSPVEWFAKDSFENAKDYYERLILQYPYRKACPAATSALDFYPAMFGLWLYVVQDQPKIKTIRAKELARDALDSMTGSGIGEDINLLSVLEPPQLQRLADTRDKMLQHGDEIASRLDQLLVSPPYSDDFRLWRLRGMVALWIADVWAVSSPSATDIEDSSSSAVPEMLGSLPGHPQVRSEREKCLAKRQAALLKAEQAFSNAKEKGGT